MKEESDFGGTEKRRWLRDLLASPMPKFGSFCRWLILAEVCGRAAKLKEFRDCQISPVTHISIRVSSLTLEDYTTTQESVLVPSERLSRCLR